MKANHKYAWCVSALLLIGLGLIQGSAAYAARLVIGKVECNGQVVLTAMFTDSGHEDRATIWRYWIDQPLEPGQGAALIVVDSKDATSATLKGDIHVLLEHARRTLVQASVSRLQLERTAPQSQGWRLPAAEVARLARLAGLPAVEAPTRKEGAAMAMGTAEMMILTVLGGGCLLAVIVVGVAAVVVFMQRRKDGGAGKNVALIVLACVVGLILIVVLCGGIGLLFVSWDVAPTVQTYEATDQPLPPGPEPPPKIVDPEERSD